LEAEWAHGRSEQVRKISPPTGIRPPDRPARNESLYRLSQPGLSIRTTVLLLLLLLVVVVVVK
jgi:hypothetical protein